MKTKRPDPETLETLRKLLPPGSTVYSIIRHVAASGMSRRIDFYAIEAYAGEASRPRYITGNVASATGRRRDRQSGAIVVAGCGSDAAFDVVHHLAEVLYPNGYPCIGDECPASDHRNHPRESFTSHASGTYALRSERL